MPLGTPKGKKEKIKSDYAFLHEPGAFSRVNIRQQAAFLQFQHMHPDCFCTEVEISNTQPQESVTLPTKTEAVLLGYHGLRHTLSGQAQQLPYASLGLHEEDAILSGSVNSHSDMLREAADLLEFQFRRRETGIPEHRKTLLLESEWQEGTTLGQVTHSL